MAPDLYVALGISGAVLAVGGALASDLIGGPTLMVFTAVLMLWSGFSVVRGGRRAAAGPGDEGIMQGLLGFFGA